MAREPGEIEIDDLSDDELQQLVVERLEEESGLDAGWLEVRVKDGVVTVAGQVGTDAEKQIAAQLVSERLGAPHFVDEIVVSELHRHELPDSIEDAADAERQIDGQLGGDDRRQSDTASHLEEDLEAETFGTHDPQKAVREGATYVPPDRPVGDGYASAEDH